MRNRLLSQSRVGKALIAACLGAAASFVLAACWPSGETDEALRMKWVVLPGASFTAGMPDVQYPACPTGDHPLECPGDAGCCPDGFAFGCLDTDSCYSQPPVQECPGYVACAPVALQITAISPGSATVGYGQSLQASVEFRGPAAAGVTGLVALLPYAGLGGRFEQPLTAEQAQAGRVGTEIRIEKERPALSQCQLECSRSGACGPCFAESIFLLTGKVDFGLEDSQGTVWGTYLDHLSFALEPSIDPGGDCAADADCASFCNTGGATWRAGARGAATNGGFCVRGSCFCCYAFGLIDPVTGAVSDNRCVACDEGGTDCDWDANLGCNEAADVCLFFLGS